MLPLATFRLANARLCNPFNHVFALLISMPHLNRIYQNSPKIKLFW